MVKIILKLELVSETKNFKLICFLHLHLLQIKLCSILFTEASILLLIRVFSFVIKPDIERKITKLVSNLKRTSCGILRTTLRGKKYVYVYISE